jgi:hypothetical protein
MDTPTPARAPAMYMEDGWMPSSKKNRPICTTVHTVMPM